MGFAHFRTVWYEILFREFPFAKQPPEYIIWRVGNSLKQPLSSIHISKNAKVSTHSNLNILLIYTLVLVI